MTSGRTSPCCSTSSRGAGLTRFEERDRIEGESLDFHERVRAMFLRLAAAQPQHYLVVDARKPEEEIERLVRERLEPLLGQATRSGGTRVMQPAPSERPEDRAVTRRGTPWSGSATWWRRCRAAAAGTGMTHAWLFTGPPGSGRSNAAVAFAAALQCEAAAAAGSARRA